jgi:predicted TIM-barrel fold metal-dependent hydrolase
MTKGNLTTIDVHAHALLPVWTSALAKATGQIAGSVKFADAPLPGWSVEGHLRVMDEHAIGASVLSLPGATSFLQGDDAKALARAMNEQFAEIIADHPHRFGAFAVLPMDDIEALLEETAYALDVLKLDGVTSEASSDGKYLGHAYYDPWLEELNRRKTTLFVHPARPRDSRWRIWALTFRFWSLCSSRPVRSRTWSYLARRSASPRLTLFLRMAAVRFRIWRLALSFWSRCLSF